MLPWKQIFQPYLVNLKDVLQLYDYIRFELRIFCNLGKTRTNTSISLRISDNCYVIFGIIGEFEKSENDIL